MVERDRRGQFRSGTNDPSLKDGAATAGSLPPVISQGTLDLTRLVNEFGGLTLWLSAPAQQLLLRYSDANLKRHAFETTPEDQPIITEIHRTVGLLLPARVAIADHYRSGLPPRRREEIFRARIQELGLTEGAAVAVRLSGEITRGVVVRVSFDSGNAALRVGGKSYSAKVWELMRDGQPYMTKGEWEAMRGLQGS